MKNGNGIFITSLIWGMIMLSILSNGLEVANVTENKFVLTGDSVANGMNFYAINFPFDVSFVPNNFNYLNGANISFNNTAKYAGNYSGKLLITFNSSQYEIKDFYIFVPEIARAEINVSSLNASIHTGESSSVDFLLTNKGNIDQNFTITPYGEISGFFGAKKILVNVGAYAAFSMNYNISENQTIGNYNGGFWFNSTKNSYKNNATIKILDGIKPVFSIIKVPEKMEAGKFFRSDVWVSDNINISKVAYLIYNGSATVAKGDFIRTEDHWAFGDKFYNTGKYTITMTAVDTSENTATLEKAFVVSLANSIDYSDSISFGTQKFNMSARKPMLFVREAMNLDIIFKSLILTPPPKINTSEQVNVTIYSPDGVRTMFAGERLTLNNFKGAIDVEVFGSYANTFSGIFEIDAPAYVNVSKHINFGGRFYNYTICQNANFYIFGTNISLEAKDVGIYEDSYCLLTEKLPIDTNITEINTPVNPLAVQSILKEKDERIFLVERQINEAKQNLNNALIVITIVAIGAYGILKIYPIWRVKIR